VQLARLAMAPAAEDELTVKVRACAPGLHRVASARWARSPKPARSVLKPPTLVSCKVRAAVERVLGRTVARDAVLMAAGLDSLGSEELLLELSKYGSIDMHGARTHAHAPRLACLCSRPRCVAACPPLPADTRRAAAHAFFMEHPSIDALVRFLEGRTLARRARAFTLLGWCSATASWAACATGHNWLRWWVLALACAALMAWQQGWLQPHRRRDEHAASPAASPAPVGLLSAALPAAALVAFTAWPTLFFVLSSLAFVFAGALPKGWLAQATGLAAGVFRDAPLPRAAPPMPPMQAMQAMQQPQPQPQRAVQLPAAAPEARAAAAPAAGAADAPPPPDAAAPVPVTPVAILVASAAAASESRGSPRAAEHEAELAHLRAGLGPEIAIEQLERGRTVGLGSYGKVMLVRHAQSGTPYALKCLNRRLVVANGQQRAVARERAVMACVSHPLCARLVRTFKDAHAVYLLLEWCPGGELLRHLPRAPGVGLPEPSARFYVACVALALEHLHALGVVYRDIKPENCLLDGEGYLKLCDFGFAKRLVADGVTHTVCGTPDFMAPEVIRGVGHGRTADLWSLGVLVYELVAGRPPFCERGAPPAAIYAAVLAGAQPPTLPGMTAPMVALVGALLVAEPHARLGAAGWGALKAHAWFEEGVAPWWEALERREVAPPLLPSLSGALDTRYFDRFPDNAVALNDTRDNDNEDDEAHAFAPEELYGSWDRSF
jgi:hypothetical protein